MRNAGDNLARWDLLRLDEPNGFIGCSPGIKRGDRDSRDDLGQVVIDFSWLSPIRTVRRGDVDRKRMVAGPRTFPDHVQDRALAGQPAKQCFADAVASANAPGSSMR